MSPEDIDKVMSEGLGRRYAFIGPFETIHLNSEGLRSCCERYGDTIYRVQRTFSEPERMEGDVMKVIHQDMVSRVPLDQLTERRKWRDTRLAALDKLKRDMENK
ncbi:hypothetical protein FSP39_016071 [Pinctada imbricata]|uniref:3-hydroxyacyl-CoA dehydrogenase C-terminal domain-containing protein n=1 Tax=Pinctada imbricata TaxID=66713 RepID=A0AA89BVV6_PINIB|nr:hypothetical protein FSP39_016071 [Pinctada imbricata]